ncbi:MAG: hypothetical protein Q7K44_01850, partial [Candidatus Liptonbacteria bacterium]|nr:hypothetical protein [Candidatus Liptonbacteria bacterium]
NPSGYFAISTFLADTGHVERLRITSGGSVGIGDTTPDEKLAVVGALKLADTNARIYFGLNGGTSYRALEGATDGTTLQIGETFATTLMYGAVQGSGSIRATGTSCTGATGKGVELQSATVNGVAGGYLDAYDRTGSAYIPLGIDSSFTEFRIAGAVKVVIDASGMVGIGTTTPQVPLDVFSTSGMRVGGSINKRVDIFTSGAGNDINTVGGILFLEFDKTSDVDIEDGALVVATNDNVSISSLFAASGEVTICSTTAVLVKRSAACTGTDLPEFYPVTSDVKPGDIVSITDIPNTIEDSNAPYLAAKSQKPYENRILGIMSSIYEHESPGEGQRKAEHYHLLALAGRVPVKISTEAGPIQIGDRITSSSLAGVGMTATSTGMTVGIALEPFDGSTATTTVTVNGQEVKTGQILVFVNLGQPQLAAAKGTGDLASMTTAGGDLNMNGFSILNVKSISGMNGLWRIDEGGNIIAQSVETQKLTVGGGAASGVTVYDRETTAPKCIYIEGGVIKTSDGACGATTNAGTAVMIETASAPVATPSSIPGTPTSSVPGIIPGVATTTPVVATTTPDIIPTATSTPIIAPAPEPVIVSTTTPAISTP